MSALLEDNEPTLPLLSTDEEKATEKDDVSSHQVSLL